MFHSIHFFITLYCFLYGIHTCVYTCKWHARPGSCTKEVVVEVEVDVEVNVVVEADVKVKVDGILYVEVEQSELASQASACRVRGTREEGERREGAPEEAKEEGEWRGKEEEGKRREEGGRKAGLSRIGVAYIYIYNNVSKIISCGPAATPQPIFVGFLYAFFCCQAAGKMSLEIPKFCFSSPSGWEK